MDENGSPNVTNENEEVEEECEGEEEEGDGEQKKIIILPSEIIIEILKFIHVTEISKISLISRMWFASSISDAIWKFYYCHQYPLPDRITEKLLRMKPKSIQVLQQRSSQVDSNTSFFCEFGVGSWRKKFLSRYVLNQNLRHGNITRKSVIMSQNIDDRLMCFDKTSDNRYLFIGTQKGFITITSLKRNNQKILNVRCHRDAIRDLIIFPHQNRHYVVSISELDHHTLQLREIMMNPSKKPTELKVVAKKKNPGHHTWFRCVQVVKSTKKYHRFPVIVTGEYKNIAFHRVYPKKSKIQTFKLLRNAHDDSIHTLRLINREEKQYLVSASDDSRIYIWDASTGRALRDLYLGYVSNVVIKDHQQLQMIAVTLPFRSTASSMVENSQIVFLQASLEDGMADNSWENHVSVPKDFFGKNEAVTALCLWPEDTRIIFCGTVHGNLYVIKMNMNSKKAKLLWKLQLDEFGGMVRRLGVIEETVYCSVDRPIRPTHTVKRQSKNSKNSKIVVVKFCWKKKESLALEKKKTGCFDEDE